MRKKQLTAFKVIIFGFISVILLGTVFLMLPISSIDRVWTKPLEALFTATSATCVTGLIVKDTATYWSIFGKTIILIMIQIGGMGVVTLTILISLIAGKRINLASRNNLKEALSLPKVGGVVKFTKSIIKITLTTEFLGAVLLAPVFINKYGIKGIVYSLFHSISAFCNAGFDLMGNFSSLTSFADQALVNTVIMFLIVFAGIGFLTWNDIKTHKFKLNKYSLQSKIILTISTILLIVPAMYFYFFEFNNWDMSTKERILVSIFQSVTCRTAGFNTIELNDMSSASKVIMICLMLIGGAPGSTAGGMKVTTIAVLILSMFSVFKNDDETEVYGRRINDNNVQSAAAIFMLYISLFITSAIVISTIEKIDILTCLFETASAVGTVGITLGITTSLSSVSRIIIIFLMFVGRVGGLTIIFAASSGKDNTLYKLPEERVTVG